MGELDIGWAIRSLKQGVKVHRAGWRDKRKFLWYKPPVGIKAEWCKDARLRELAEASGGEIPGLGVICMYLVDHAGTPTVLTGWHPTPCDLLATDWEMLEDEK